MLCICGISISKRANCQTECDLSWAFCSYLSRELGFTATNDHEVFFSVRVFVDRRMSRCFPRRSRRDTRCEIRDLGPSGFDIESLRAMCSLNEAS